MIDPTISIRLDGCCSLARCWKVIAHPRRQVAVAPEQPGSARLRWPAFPRVLARKGSGRAADVVTKAAREVTLVGKADRQRHLRKRQLGLANMFPRPLDARAFQVANRRHTDPALELLAEVEAAEPRYGGQLAQGDGTIGLFVDICQSALD
jgi:hypothetical protein